MGQSLLVLIMFLSSSALREEAFLLRSEAVPTLALTSGGSNGGDRKGLVFSSGLLGKGR